MWMAFDFEPTYPIQPIILKYLRIEFVIVRIDNYIFGWFHSLSCSPHLTHPHIKCRSISAALHALAILYGRCDCACCIYARCVCARCIYARCIYARCVCARCIYARCVCARCICALLMDVLFILTNLPSNQPTFFELSQNNY